MPKASQASLANCERRYRELAQELAAIGYIASGSMALRYNVCGKAYCACHSDPARRHGPYWLFTAKVDGKTVNKRLTEAEARLYEQWIANDRKARALLGQMRAVAAEAAALILAEEAPDPEREAPATPSPQTRRPASRRSR
ncbi:MAG: DUF6788 family protein [Acidimicrobiales bacterium]